MKLWKVSISALVAVFLLACSSVAFGQCGSSSGGCRSGASSAVKKEKPKSEVKLAAWQQKKMDQIDKARDAKIAAIRPKLDKARQEINKLTDDPKASDKALALKVKQAMGYQAQMVIANLVAQRQKDRIYTPEQTKKLAAAQGGCGCGSQASTAASKSTSKQPATSGGGCGSSCGG